MNTNNFRACSLMSALLLALTPALAQQDQSPQAAGADAVAPAKKTFSQQELDQLMAPIALYPDALLAQILMASTYPLEVVEAARWSKANSKVTGKALEDAMTKQSWDPSVKALTSVPQVLQQMNEKLDWTQKLGDAFLAQQQDLMNTVQALRAKADKAGNLKTTEQQVVKTQTQGSETIYVVESSKPEVVYVPTYNPSVVYGTWWYPTPPYYMYPPAYVYPPGLAFATGIFVGAAIWGNCNWGGGGNNNVNIDVDRYNSFNRTNVSNKNWNHNVDHRRGVAYKDQGVAKQYNRGGNTPQTKAREDFRGRADAGRDELKGMDRKELDNRVRDAERGAQAGDRDRGDRGDRGGAMDSGGSRFDGADRAKDTAGRGDTGSRGGFDGGASRDHSRDGGGFSGVNNAPASREASSRGSASRADMGSRSSGARSAGTGGFSGGGGRMGGGGGRGGGGRR